MLAKIFIHTNIDAIKQTIKEQLLKQNITNPHPDLIYFEAEEKLGVEAAKKIRAHLGLKPVSLKVKAVVLESAASLTPEAQNSLLKTLEEPPQQSLIILGTTSEDKLLATIISRCEIIHLDSVSTPGVDTLTCERIKRLIGSSVADRFVFVEKLEDKDQFLRALVNYLQDQKPSRLHIGGVRRSEDFLEDLLQAEIWVNHKVNIRAVLEYLMLKLPQRAFPTV